MGFLSSENQEKIRIKNFSRFQRLNSLQRLFVPILFFSANDNYDKEKEEYYGLTVSSNGDVGWFYPTIFKSSCTIDVTYFPFDDQVIRSGFFFSFMGKRSSSGHASCHR